MAFSRLSLTGTLICLTAVLPSCGDDAADGQGGSGSGGEAGSGATAGSGGSGAGGGTGGGGAGGMGGMGGGGPCVNSLEANPTAPMNLSDTGLYSDIGTKELAPYVDSFTPQFVLWTDGALKERFVYIPECETIDTTDMDYWQFPVGTRIWKQFAIGAERVETRMLHRFGRNSTDWLMVAYQWDDEETEAINDATVQAGVENVKGTNHDIPSASNCTFCHGNGPQGGTPSRILGFGAIQLSHAGSDVTMDTLIADNKLSAPPAGAFTVPGTAGVQDALGYLHANCGNCHNGQPGSVAAVDLNLALEVGATTPEATNAYAEIDAPTTLYKAGLINRITAGDLDASAVFERTAHRNGEPTFPANVQMPPIGSEIIDPVGVATLEYWILNELP